MATCPLRIDRRISSGSSIMSIQSTSDSGVVTHVDAAIANIENPLRLRLLQDTGSIQKLQLFRGMSYGRWPQAA